MAVYVSIGRNVGDQPMNAERWEAFRNETRRVVDTLAGPWVTSATGTGRFAGTLEETYVVVSDGSRLDQGFNPVGEDDDGEPLGWWEVRTRDLYAALGTLAAQYGQESIAVTIGEPEFVQGKVYADGS